MMNRKLTAIELKKINRNRIYKFIYRNRGISRQDIASELELSLPTVNQNLKELSEAGYIGFEGSFQSTGGRKAQVIVPVSNAKVSIGIDIHKNYVRVLAVDMYGVVLDYEKYLKVFSLEEEYSRYLAYLVDNIIGHNHFGEDQVLGVGIAIPGVFDKDKKIVLKAPSLQIGNFPISLLMKYMKYPYLVENDAKAGAFTEYWNNIDSETKVYLSIEKGIGGCIIRSDGLEKGSHHRSGEFGHMLIQPDGRACNCGNKGCLEAYISTSRLSDDLGCEVEDFFAELATGNEKYKKIWEEYEKYLCIGIHNIYMMYDVDIILGGILAQYLDPYLPEIKKRLAKLNFFEETGDYLSITQYQSKATAIGAALQLISGFMETI
ncbi:hypothetical protein lbkm_2511 [Lachnospiraceae bacterium KM106-2]|nr:hypothetical protein lbkm_2511 [Lachnospiraceae bacterium KM106-2]